MVNYDKLFEDNINKEFYFNAPEYSGKKIMSGYISLSNAKERLNKDEYYTLVSYIDGEKLPDEYIPYTTLKNGELLATFNPNLNMTEYCKDSNSIQKVSKLSNDKYMLGPGPDEISIFQILEEQEKEYKEMFNSDKEDSNSYHM